MLELRKLRRLPKGADLSHIHPDLRDKAVPITALSGHPDNPRKHPDANKHAIAGSLRKYLQRKPVVANMTSEGLRIEAGHGVYGEMLAAGSQYIACTIVEDDPVTELGFMLADNRSGDLSEDDPEKLAPLLRQLIDAGEDVEEIGWDDAAVRGLLGEGKEGKEEQEGNDSSPDDDTPVNRADELQKEWRTARGQVWEIPSVSVPGQCHRVVCGDSLDPAVIALVLDGRKPDGVWSDAPYGIAVVEKSGRLKELGYTPVHGDTTRSAAQNMFRQLFSVYDTVVHIWWGANHYSECLPASPCWVVWDKQAGKSVDFADCELAWTNQLEPARIFTHVWDGFRRDSEKGASRYHPTQKPVALFEWCAQKYLPGQGKVWLDPFAGSGISLLGAERLSQIACCIELSEAYVAVILQRAKDVGMQPRLANV